MNWESILIKCGVKAATARQWADAFASLVKPSNFSLGFDEIDDFLAQILHESGMLERTVENLNYTTAERIKAVWPSRFATVEDAKPFARNPQALANKVYGGRMGNVEPNDGYKFRGRGLIMVTGRENYARLGKLLGVNLLTAPERLTVPYVALKSAIAWWEGNVPDSVMGDVVKVTKKVNGGTVGLDHRRKLAELAAKAIAEAK